MSDWQKACNTLEVVHPSWCNDVKSSHFKSWLTRQSPQFRRLDSSHDVRDAQAMLDRYYADRAKKE